MMLDLAENQGDGFIALKDIASRQGISKKYLEQIVPILNNAGMLKTSRGNQGGYRLAIPPEQYTAYDILSAAEGGIAPVACLEQDEMQCPRSSCCATLPLWKGLNDVIKGYLSSITLKDILDHYKSSASNDYTIHSIGRS